MKYGERKVESVQITDDHRGDVVNIKATQDAKFVFIGISQTNSFGCFLYEKETFELKLMKWVNISFLMFEMDNSCTQVIFLNQKSRVLEFYGIKWLYDKSQLNLDEYKKLDDAIIEEDEERYN